MPTVAIDNQRIEVPDGATLLDAANAAGIEIPTLCHRPGCQPNTSCMACVVRVNGAARLVPSCATVAVEGMVVESETPAVHQARRTALELLLGEHAGDCLAPCEMICPAHMDIPRMLDHIAAGRDREALITIKEAIALPAVLGRICPELCERGCRRSKHDSPVAICKLKRFAADADLASDDVYLPECAALSGHRVAVVGAGPAGLAAALELRRRGHEVTIFDQAPRPGGALRDGVGRDVLPERILDAEIDVIRAVGVRFEQACRLGTDRSLDDLRRGHDAVILAIGAIDAERARELSLPCDAKGLRVDRQTLATPLDGVFAAGASALGPLKHAIRSIASGRSAGQSVDQALRGESPARRHGPFTVRLGVLEPRELEVFLRSADPAARVDGPEGLSVEAARAQAARCLQCACSAQDDCRLRYWSDRYSASPSRYKLERRAVDRIETHPLLVWEPGKCISCGLCVQIAAASGAASGMTFIGRGFQMRIAPAMGADLVQGLESAARRAAEACPTAALRLRAASSDSKSA